MTPGNRFWPAALEAGLASRGPRRSPRPPPPRHGDDGPREAGDPRAAELARDEYRDGLARLDRLCAWLRPAAVCFVGLAGWRAAVDRHAQPGWQPAGVGGRPAYVLPSTSGLNAATPLAGPGRPPPHRPRRPTHARLADRSSRGSRMVRLYQDEPSRDRRSGSMDWSARKARLTKEKEATKARDGLSAERRELPMVEVTKDYAFEGPGRHRVARRPVRGPAAAHRVPLHVPPGLGRRLPELHGRHRRDLARVHRAPAHARHELRAWCRGRRSPSSSAGRRSAAGTTSRGTPPTTATSATTSAPPSTRHAASTSSTTARSTSTPPWARRACGTPSSPTTCRAARASSRSTAGSSAPTP